MEDINKKIIVNERNNIWIQAVLAFFSGAVIAISSLPYSIMPLGISAVCADKKTKPLNIAVILGVIGAYILKGFQPVYFAALLFSIPLKIIVTYFMPRRKAKYTPALTAFFSLTFLYLTLYIQYGMLTFDLITGIAGIISGCIFAVVFSSAYKILFTPQYTYGALNEKETVSLILFLSIMLTCASQTEIMGLSIARSIGVIITLFFVSYSKTGFGVVAALLTSIACAVGQPDIVYLGSAYGISALVMGWIPYKKKYFSVISFLGAFSLSALYFQGDIQTLAAITEAALGCTVYLLLPQKATDYIAASLKLKGNISAYDQENRLRKLICLKLKNASDSMAGISQALTRKSEDNKMDIYQKVREIEDTVCKNCRLNAKCWVTDFNTTRDVFNKSANIILKNLQFNKEDLPQYFIDTCIKTDKLYSAFKDLSEENRTEIIQERSTAINRKIMAAQYEGISAFIKEICSEISAISEFDENAAEKIRDYFSGLGIDRREVTVYYDNQNAIHIEANVISDKKLFERKISTELSDILGRNIICDSIVQQENIYRMKFIQQEKYSLTVAQTARNKDGERVCGDSFTTFKSKSYRQVLALADGMGSGKEADRLSNLTLDILRNLLENGFGEEKACSLVNSTLLLGGDGQSFSTLDMASIDLFNGRADFYKLGAAPTLILRDGKAYEIFCASLPAGILGESKAEHRNCKLRDGDMIIMLSDGVDIDKKMLSVCKDNAKENPITLCERIMETATVDGKADDDMTVAIAKVNLKKSA